MKFVCSHCKAKYQLADEKIAGRTLRMTCRTCGQEILIRADPSQSASSSETLAPPGASAHRSLPAGPRVAPPPAQLVAPAPTPLGARGSQVAAAPRFAPPPPPSPLGADFRAARAPGPAPAIGPPDEWHVAIDDEPIGPIHREEVARKIAAGALGPDSLAWREGLDDWMPIHDIPELMVLCRQTGAAAAPSETAHAPSAIGGRMGATPGFAAEDWAPVGERSAERSAPHVHVPAHAPLGAAPAAPRQSAAEVEAELSALRGRSMPSWPVLFALMGGFAFLMAVVAILGARFLSVDKTAAPSAPQQAQNAQTPTAPAAPEPVAERVIELEEQVLDDATADKGRSSGARSTTTTTPKKELTDAQKAMLARMGGDGADLSGLSQKSAEATGPARGGGSLTASELSSVVNRNKKQLQRCYETALRGAGSDDTVRLDVSITIAPSGAVSAVQLGGQGLPGMSECIERTVRSWRFPSAGEASATRFPLLFQPGS